MSDKLRILILDLLVVVGIAMAGYAVASVLFDSVAPLPVTGLLWLIAGLSFPLIRDLTPEPKKTKSETKFVVLSVHGDEEWNFLMRDWEVDYAGEGADLRAISARLEIHEKVVEVSSFFMALHMTKKAVRVGLLEIGEMTAVLENYTLVITGSTRATITLHFKREVK